VKQSFILHLLHHFSLTKHIKWGFDDLPAGFGVISINNDPILMNVKVNTLIFGLILFIVNNYSDTQARLMQWLTHEAKPSTASMVLPPFLTVILFVAMLPRFWHIACFASLPNKLLPNSQ
jgi:hypothetical protein